MRVSWFRGVIEHVRDTRGGCRLLAVVNATTSQGQICSHISGFHILCHGGELAVAVISEMSA